MQSAPLSHEMLTHKHRTAALLTVRLLQTQEVSLTEALLVLSLLNELGELGEHLRGLWIIFLKQVRP